MPSADQVDEIRRQMAMIRRELHADVQGVVAGAEAVTDWRRYLKDYAWVAVGLSFAVGYLVVPKRRKSVAEVVREAVPEVKATAAAPSKKEKKAGLIGTIFGMLMPLAVRAAQGYAMKYVEAWMAQQGAVGPVPAPAPGGPIPGVGRHGGAPGRPGTPNR